MIQDANATRRDKRRQAMLDAAAALFSEKGYEAATLSEVVARSGGSLTTLYELFGNKAGLLAAMVGDRCSHVQSVIDDAGGSPDAADALCRIGRFMLDQLLDPEGIALFRIVIAESPRQPELGRLLYESGPLKGRRTLGRYLATLGIEEPEEAAVHFFHMLLGDLQMRLLCGLAAFDAGRDTDAYIRRTVAAFLRLYAPQP